MTTPTPTADRALLEAALAASQAFTASLERALGIAPSATPRVHPVPGEGDTTLTELALWDPLTDVPLVQPKAAGTREEQDWCGLVYLSSVWATNVREGRGANRDEIPAFAVRAGYRDGRSVTAWSKGNGATRNDEQKQRWMTENGKKWTLGYAEQCGVRLPDDIVADYTESEAK